MEEIKDKLERLSLEELMNIVREINSYDSSLDWLDFEYNDEEFFKVFFGDNVIEAVRAAHFGNYNFTDEYVIFDGYGNLNSFSEYQIEEEIRNSLDEIAERITELKDEIDSCTIQVNLN